MSSEYVKFCPVCNKTRQNMNWCKDEKYKEFSKGFHHVFSPKEGLTICPSCKKGMLEDSVLTHEEFKIIDNVSDSDRQFLEAMIELKKNDPIEYQLKMSQFKANLKQQEQVQESRAEENTVHCPTCNSTNVNRISTTAKATNTILFGIFGTKRHKTFHCNNCKYEW